MKKVIPSFSDISKYYDDKIEMNSVNGFAFQQRAPIGKYTELITYVSMKPKEIRIISDGKGGQMKATTRRRCFQLSLETKLMDSEISAVLGDAKMLSVKISPVNFFSFSSSVIKTTNQMQESISGEIYTPFSTVSLLCKVDKNYSNPLFEVDTTIGTKSNTVCLQVLKNIGYPEIRFSLGYNKIIGKDHFFTAIISDGDNKFFNFRYVKKINDNWKATVSYQLNQKLESMVTAAWRGKIGKNHVRSAINTNGLVKTEFRRKVTPNFDFIVNGSLDHNTNSYRTGFALSWFPSKE